MRAEEIRKLQSDQAATARPEALANVLLAEIAAQLAELNENLEGLMAAVNGIGAAHEPLYVTEAKPR